MTTPVYDNILARRSIRHFMETKVEREKIDLLLRAAMAAPSACNLQPWAFVVVDDEQLLEKVKRTAPGQGEYNAPLAIVVCGVTEHLPWKSDAWMQECGAAAQNMLLCAVEQGLGGVWIGGFDGDALQDVLGIPDDVQPMCILELGYPAYKLAPKTWHTAEAVHYNGYDRNKPRKLRTLDDLMRDVKCEKPIE